MKSKTRVVRIGKIAIGGANPIAVQSMTNTPTTDVKKTVEQVMQLVEAGCEIVRIAVPDMNAVSAMAQIRKETNDIPLVADIHYDYRLAIAVMPYVDKVRINPGNIGGLDKFAVVVKEAKDHGLSLRIGVNSGSLEPGLPKTPEGMAQSAVRWASYAENLDFYNIVLSAKMSDPLNTIKTYKLISEKLDYPLHIGVTEAGDRYSGAIRSAVALGILLYQGIGDTIRVSLTGDPVYEVHAAYEILNSLNLRRRGVWITSCPTCARTTIDVEGLVYGIKNATSHIKEPIHIAVMGCPVNGPGEAQEADIGITGAAGVAMIFRGGKIIRRIPKEEAITALLEEIEKMKKEEAIAK
ncbi:MAG: flavodoxin-dependent (E)-4-hydroxy-3-methylbut-2-enyl-diphosphate synthase [Candidatus Korarchaeota archaeon]